MGEDEHRQIARDSLFVMAELRLDGVGPEHRVRVRNLSSGGLMAESNLRVARGQLLTINIRNIGWVEGSVAWVQDNRFGIAFRDEIDPKIARGQKTPDEPDYLVRRPIRSARQRGDGLLRKI